MPDDTPPVDSGPTKVAPVPAPVPAPVLPESLTIQLVTRDPSDTFTVHIKRTEADTALEVPLVIGTDPQTLPYAEAEYVLDMAQRNGINIVVVPTTEDEG